jgi:hypothetical protein
LGLNNIADPLFGTLALAFLTRGIRANRRANYALAGAMLGLTQYFYEGGRFLYPALVIGWMGLCWLFQRGSVNWRYALTGLQVAVIVAAPLYLAGIATGTLFAPRMQREGMQSGTLLYLLTGTGEKVGFQYASRFGDPFLFYVAYPDLSWFYGGYQPLVISALVPLFLLGVAFLSWNVLPLHKLRPALQQDMPPETDDLKPDTLYASGMTRHSTLILLWLILTGLGNGLLKDNLWAPRYVVVFPALALTIALGFYYTLALIWPGSRQLKVTSDQHPAISSPSALLGSRRSVLKISRRTLIATILIVALSLGQVAYYFFDHLPTFNHQFTTYPEWSDAFFRMQALPSGTQAHIVSTAIIFPFNVQTFVKYLKMNIEVTVTDTREFNPGWLYELPLDVPQAFFIELNDVRTRNRLHDRFGSRLSSPRYSPFTVLPDRQLVLYYVSPSGAPTP